MLAAGDLPKAEDPNAPDVLLDDDPKADGLPNAVDPNALPVTCPDEAVEEVAAVDDPKAAGLPKVLDPNVDPCPGVDGVAGVAGEPKDGNLVCPKPKVGLVSPEEVAEAPPNALLPKRLGGATAPSAGFEVCPKVDAPNAEADEASVVFPNPPNPNDGVACPAPKAEGFDSVSFDLLESLAVSCATASDVVDAAGVRPGDPNAEFCPNADDPKDELPALPNAGALC